jgi:phosphate transport system substrate-binding protein
MTTQRVWRLSMLRGAAFLTGCLVAGAVAAQAEPAGPAVRVAVDSDVPAYAPKPGVSGAVTVAGSETLQPIIARIASVFKQWQPNVKIAVQGGGTDAALTSFLRDIAGSRRGDGDVKGHLSANDVALLASSRSLTEKERRDFQSRYGYEPTEIPIALDAVAIYVHRRNPVEGVTVEQLDAIFGRDRKRGAAGDVTSWGQIGAAGEWAEQPIHLYGRDLRSGTRTFFKQTVLLDGEFKGTVREEIGYASEILAISRDVLAIGYAGIGFQSSHVRVLPVSEKAGGPFIAPSAESATSGAYPLSRKLYLYAKRDPRSGLDPAALEFLKFINSREGQAAVAKAGAYPLPAAQTATNVQLLTGVPQSAPLIARDAY